MHLHLLPHKFCHKVIQFYMVSISCNISKAIRKIRAHILPSSCLLSLYYSRDSRKESFIFQNCSWSYGFCWNFFKSVISLENDWVEKIFWQIRNQFNLACIIFCTGTACFATCFERWMIIIRYLIKVLKIFFTYFKEYYRVRNSV